MMAGIDSLVKTGHGLLAYLVIIFVSCDVAMAATSCPTDANQQAMRCLLGLGSGISLMSLTSNKSIAIGDQDKAIIACGNGDFLDAINCMERLMERCKYDNTDDAHYLRKMIDIDKARQTITFFCTNVNEYVREAECVAKHQRQQTACLEESMRTFRTQERSTSNLDSLMRFQCSFYYKASTCTEQVLSQRCSSELTHIVTTVIAGFEPPLCTDFKSGGVQAGKTGVNYDVNADHGESSEASHSFGVCKLMLVVLVNICLALQLL